ncbi:MAG TPA: MFS transporter [Burkholderiaceae bacterium]|nr:MFS transporter [Burkholderiaceae bacterium]
MSDMGLQAVSLSAIQAEYGMGDAAAGALQGLAGVLVGSALAMPLARFADRYSRKRVLLWLIVASTAMMLLSALAPNFALFFVGRSAAGITEFAMVPLVYSMIPDLAPERHRVPANLVFAALMASGASGGFYFSRTLLAAATWLPLELDAWRGAFMLLGLAGVPLLALGLFVTDPPRHGVTPGSMRRGSLWRFLYLRRHALAYFAGAAGCMIVAVQAVNHLISLALERRFEAGRGDIGHAMGVIVLISALGCLPVAGVLDRVLVPRLGTAARPTIMFACTLLAIPALIMLDHVNRVDLAFVVVGVTLFTTSTANALVPTMLQDLTSPAVRASTFALWSFVVSVFGAAGPLLAGALSEGVLNGQLVRAIALAAIPALSIATLCALRLALLTGGRKNVAAHRATRACRQQQVK